MPRILAGVSAAFFLLNIASAHAQSADSTGATASTSTTAQSASLFSQMWGTKTDVSVGLGAGIDQRYMGASAFRPLIVPMLTVSRGIFFLDTTRGVGIQYQSSSGFYASDAFNYDQGRDNRNDWLRPGSNYLKNMGSVKGTITNTVTLSQQIVSWLSVNAQAEIGLDGHERGNQYQFGLESIPFKRGPDTLTLDLDAKMGDGQYNQTYFGVTPIQSRNTGFSRYSPGFGLYAYSFSVTWDHRFTKHWSTELVVSTSLYTNKVADSAVVQQRFGVTVLPSVSYAF